VQELLVVRRLHTLQFCRYSVYWLCQYKTVLLCLQRQ
jgi:hypothetical protein